MTVSARFLCPLVALLGIPSIGLIAGEGPLHGDGETGRRTTFGFDWSEGWFDRPALSHLSPRGVPLTHSFRLEPAQIHQDLFLDYSFRTGTEGTEHEIELELELALTRRIGLVIETPYRFVNPANGPSVDGFGDLAISPRFLLAEYDRFSLAFNFETELPTANADRGLGSGEVALAPSFSTWMDLGNWWTLSTQTGIERALSSRDSELFFRTSLVHTFGGDRPAALSDRGHDHGHAHLRPGLLSVILEADGAMGLSSGAGKGVVGVEGMLGVYYRLIEDFDIRVGYQFPLSTPREFDGGLLFGVVWLY